MYGEVPYSFPSLLAVEILTAKHLFVPASDCNTFGK